MYNEFNKGLEFVIVAGELITYIIKLHTND
jgi:hypothetical protein